MKTRWPTADGGPASSPAAARGIGRAIALDLAQTHHVIATYRNRAMPPKVSSRIRRRDLRVRYFISAKTAPAVAFAQRKFSGLDLLVNNAGMGPRNAAIARLDRREFR
jgi:NAD(P)-dependent dehydrogenase (short-subunit alcohol dehydrogenase family)